MFKRKLRKYFRELIESQTKPKEIASGVALGIFIGFLPVWGLLQFLIALFFIAILKINKLAIILGTFVTNPVTIPFLYTFSFRVGKLLLKSEVESISIKNITVAHILAIAKPLIVGSIVVGLVAAVIAYLVTYLIAWFIYTKITRANK